MAGLRRFYFIIVFWVGSVPHYTPSNFDVIWYIYIINLEIGIFIVFSCCHSPFLPFVLIFLSSLLHIICAHDWFGICSKANIQQVVCLLAANVMHLLSISPTAVQISNLGHFLGALTKFAVYFENVPHLQVSNKWS